MTDTKTFFEKHRVNLLSEHTGDEPSPISDPVMQLAQWCINNGNYVYYECPYDPDKGTKCIAIVTASINPSVMLEYETKYFREFSDAYVAAARGMLAKLEVLVQSHLKSQDKT